MRVKHKYKLRGIIRNEHGRIIHADISFAGTLRNLEQRMDGAQEAIDTAFQRYLMAYVPVKSKALQQSIPENTHVGTGSIVVGTNYGHFQNFLDMPYKDRRPADRARHAANPERASHFIERTIQDHGDDAIAEGQKALDGKR